GRLRRRNRLHGLAAWPALPAPTTQRKSEDKRANEPSTCHLRVLRTIISAWPNSQLGTNQFEVPARARMGGVDLQRGFKLFDRGGEVAGPGQNEPQVISQIGIARAQRDQLTVARGVAYSN